MGVLARDALVGFLAKMNKVDENEHGGTKRRRRRPRQPWEPEPEQDDELLPYVGMFGHRERALFRQEILQQIVIGLGQLDDDEDDNHRRQQQHNDHDHQLPERHSDWSNPYFPPVSYDSALHSKASDSHSSPKRSPNGTQKSSPSNSPRLGHSSSMEILQKTSSSPSHSSLRGELTSKSGASGTSMNVDNDVYVFVMYPYLSFPDI